MYVRNPRVIRGGFGEVQTGTLNNGAAVMLPVGTVLSVFNPQSAVAPRSVSLKRETPADLFASVAVSGGPVIGADLVRAGGEVVLESDVSVGLPAGVISNAKTGPELVWIVTVPKGTVVRILSLDNIERPPQPPVTPPVTPGDGVGVPAVPTQAALDASWQKRARTATWIGAGALVVGAGLTWAFARRGHRGVAIGAGVVSGLGAVTAFGVAAVARGHIGRPALLPATTEA